MWPDRGDVDLGVTSHLEEALPAVECDVVIVVTPPPMHAVQCRLAIAAGKHVYVEKPFWQRAQARLLRQLQPALVAM